MKLIPTSAAQSSKWTLLANAVFFQINWFICIFLPMQVALVSTALLLLFHFYSVSRQRREWLLIFAFSLLGYGCDSLLINLDLMSYSEAFSVSINEQEILQCAPLWLLFLWLSFASCLNHSLRYLQQRLWLASALVIVAIPFNYFIGANITESQFLAPVSFCLAVITAYWMLLLLLFLPIFSRCR